MENLEKISQIRLNWCYDKNYIKRLLFNINTDICSSVNSSTVTGENYFVLVRDEYTHYYVTYLLSHTSDIFVLFKDLETISDPRFNSKTLY